MNTTRYRLKDLLKIGNGKDHSGLAEGAYPVYGSGGVMRYVDQYLYQGESVLLPRKGTLSNIQYVNGAFWTVDTCYYTVINTERVVPYYLFRLLRSLDLSGLDSGASIPSMTSKCYYGIKVNLPSETVQRRIASILSAYDELIEKNNRKIAILQEQAQALYKEWFVRFRFPGFENARFENGLPEGWEIERMEDFCTVTDGTHDTPTPTEDGVPLITGRCIENGYINFDAAYCISFDDHKKIKKRSGLSTGDLLFSNIGTVGNTCRVQYDREFSVKNVIIFKPQSIKMSNYLYFYLTSKSAQELFSLQTNGASQQFVGLTFMRRFKTVVPSKKVIERFTCVVGPMLAECDNLTAQNRNLTRQRDLLLPRLMSGKLEVN